MRSASTVPSVTLVLLLCDKELPLPRFSGRSRLLDSLVLAIGLTFVFGGWMFLRFLYDFSVLLLHLAWISEWTCFWLGLRSTLGDECYE